MQKGNTSANNFQLSITLHSGSIVTKARTEFKICLLAFKALTCGESKYLANLLNLQNVHMGMGLRSSDDPTGGAESNI